MKDKTGAELSKSEKNVMTALSMQFSYKEIAECLHISVNTVKKHTKNIYRKLGVGKRAGAIEKYVAADKEFKDRIIADQKEL
jgi:DNA-binding CsgD family transcriptional regulator